MSSFNPFPIPALDDGSFATGCTAACGGNHTSRLLVRAVSGLELAGLRYALKSGDRDLSQKAIDRLMELVAQGEIVALKEGETPAGAWFDLEELLGDLLAGRFYSAAKRVILPLLKPFFTAEGESFDDAGFAHAVAEGNQALGDDLTQTLAPDLHTQIASIVAAGEADIASGILAQTSSVKEVVDALWRSTMLYADGFFPNFVIPAINREIEQTLSEGALARPNLTPIYDSLNARLAGDSYLNLVANATTSRAYHYGYLKAAQAQSYQIGVFSAVIDQKTSDICRSLNGKQFMIADLLDKYERSAKAQNTDELKEIAPWFSRDRATPLDQDVKRFLDATGVPTPPLHGFCRSTILIL